MRQQPCAGSGALSCPATSVTFTWTSPSTAAGPLTMNVVVVQNISAWWSETYSLPASAGSTPPPTGAPPPTTPPPPLATPVNGTAQCQYYCDNMAFSCSKQFTDKDTCLRYCLLYPVGFETDTAGNTLGCRLYHLRVAQTLNADPDSQRWHCSHAGPTGGLVCYDVEPANLCDQYCNVLDAVCQGPNTQYKGGVADCLAVCPLHPSVTTASTPRTPASKEADISTVSGNSIECRNYHLQVASQGSQAAAIHCIHSGPSGGGGAAVCGSFCDAYCDIYTKSCTVAKGVAASYVYASVNDCLTKCANFDLTGENAYSNASSGDTGQCRLYYAQMAAIGSNGGPAVNCPIAWETSSGAANCSDPCADYCTEIATTCTGATGAQFPGQAGCLADCAARPQGKAGDIAGDSVSCRAYHVGVATATLASDVALAARHCSHGGPTGGGGVCGGVCENYCNNFFGYCNSQETVPFLDMADCMTFCSLMDQSDATDQWTVADYATPAAWSKTLGCRFYHITVAQNLASTMGSHCSHADLSGGVNVATGTGVCGNLTENYCQYLKTTCPTSFAFDFADDADCISWAGTVSTGILGATSGDTLACRWTNLMAAIRLSPKAGLNNDYCEAAGMSGGTVCSTLCPDYCADIQTKCSANMQYGAGTFDMTGCLGTCQQTPTGTSAATGVNTMGCRTGILAGTTLTAADCAAAGPAGNSTSGPQCGGFCENYCTRILLTCTGANTQYTSKAACMTICASMTDFNTDFKSSPAPSSASLQCRIYHLTAALSDPQLHCPHAGFLGAKNTADTGCGSFSVNFCTLFPTVCPATYAADAGSSNPGLCEDVYSATRFASGVAGDTGGDTLACRGYHVQVAAQGSLDNVHCTHASVSGGGVCVNAPSCAVVCANLTSVCTGANQQLIAAPAFDCMAWCSTLSPGALGATTGNTVGCRQYHVGVAASAPAVHCPHAGFSGGTQCGGLCENYCAQIQTTCTGINAQYESVAACLARCSAFNQSEPFTTASTGGPSLACRSYHLQAAMSTGTGYGPAAHCAHAGPSGGGVCGNLCEAYCDLMMNTCVTPTISANTFASRAACMSACGQYSTVGTLGDTSGDTLQCRFYHVGVAAVTDPAAHCAHASAASVPGVCAGSGVVTCPSGKTQKDVLVLVATKPAGSPGYPAGYTINGSLQANICIEQDQCILFEVGTADCFHPFYIDANASNPGGSVDIPTSIVSPVLASAQNKACMGSKLAFYGATAGSYTYQCTVHRQMGGLITVNPAGTPCAANPPPSPPATTGTGPTPTGTSTVPATGTGTGPAPGTSPAGDGNEESHAIKFDLFW